MKPWIANGPDGSELIGYLAAVGWLSLVDAGAPGAGRVSLFWERQAVGWRPRLLLEQADEEEGWYWLERGLRRMAAALSIEGVSSDSDTSVFPLEWKNPTDADRESIQRLSNKAVRAARPPVELPLDVLSCLVTDAAVLNTKVDELRDTDFRTMRGAGEQHFVAFGRKLLSWALRSPRNALAPSLASTWRYANEAKANPPKVIAWTPSLRWDPIDNRSHALLGRDPDADLSKEERAMGPSRPTEAGANVLAFSALRLFPVMPAGTLGWSSHPPATVVGTANRRSSAPCFTWGLHRQALTIEGLRALHRHPALAERFPSTRVVASLGLDEVRRAARVSAGKYRAVSPAWTVSG